MTVPTRDDRAHKKRQIHSDFIAREIEIDIFLVRLAALSDEHFGYELHEINWPT